MSTTAKRGKSVFRETERALAALASEQTASNVHKFRTSTRRLQTVLEQLLPEQDRSQKKLLKLLDRIRRRAGKVRDIDLQLAALRTVKVPLQPRRKTQFMHALIELRVKHENRLRKLLKKTAVLALQKRLRRNARQTNFDQSQDALLVAREMLASIRSSHPPNRPLTDDVLHQYRLTVKRARYAAEFASPSPASKEFLAQLKHLQDVTGLWHDWFLLTGAARRRLGEVGQSPLVAVLHNITRVKFRNAVSALATSSAMPPANVAGSEASSAESARQKRVLTVVARRESAA